MKPSKGGSGQVSVAWKLPGKGVAATVASDWWKKQSVCLLYKNNRHLLKRSVQSERPLCQVYGVLRSQESKYPLWFQIDQEKQFLPAARETM